MQNDTLVLDQLRGAYKAAVEEWIAAIKQEEALASVDHSVAEVDQCGAGALKGRRNSQQSESCEEAI
jgi:hypothetical protein